MQPNQRPPDDRYVRLLTELRVTDIPLVGDQNARLGELSMAFGNGVPILDGFAVTTAAYHAFVAANNLRAPISEHVTAWQRDEATLQQVGKAIRRLFLSATFPQEIAAALWHAYQKLNTRSPITDAGVAVRSSATAENPLTACGAGRSDTLLHVTGEQELLEACRICYASLFSDRALSYRADHGINHLDAAVSIGVQRMVGPEPACAGVICTMDTETGFPCVVRITAARGLGESVVQGTVQPDRYEVFTPVLRQGLYPIIEKRLGEKACRVVGSIGDKPTKTVEDPLTERHPFVLVDDEILLLTRWAVAIEEHFDQPMVIDWVKDGRTGELYIDQVRPEISHLQRAVAAHEAFEVNLDQIPETRTHIMLDIAEPDLAMHWWRLPCHGIAPVRMGFLLNDVVKIHPMALVRFDQLTDVAARTQIQRLTRGYADKTEYFVETLARGIAKIAASQHPKPVIVSMSDFKTNEYANLIGGKQFEPAEANPVLGRRGASRYYSEDYREGFALECKAITRVREQMGLKNVIVMIPFCRTPGEADHVLAEAARNGLTRGEHGLQVYMTCELPSHVIHAEEFARRFDGFSIDIDNLTQMVLGVDRDSVQLAQLFDPRDGAVKWMILKMIGVAHAAGSKVGIYGRAPSDYPDFAAFLVEAGIDSISLDPARVIPVKRWVAEIEHALAQPRPPVLHSRKAGSLTKMSS